MRHFFKILALILGLNSSAVADTYLLTNTPSGGVTTNPGEFMQTTYVSGSPCGFTPTHQIDAAVYYWYGPAVTGTYAAGNHTFLLWSNQPGGGVSNVIVDFGYTNADGSGYVPWGSSTLDVNASGLGNHITTFTFPAIPALVLTNQRLRIRITFGGGGGNFPIMAYNACPDFDTRLLTPPLAPFGTPTISPTFTRTWTPSPTPMPALNKSVNTTSAILGQTITFTLSYQNPNPNTATNCTDDFEAGTTLWPSGWSAPTGGTWNFTADNGPTLPGTRSMDASNNGGYHFSTINCADPATDGSIQSDIKVMAPAGEFTMLWRQNGSSTYQLHVQQGTTANVSLRVVTLAAPNTIAVVNYTINTGTWYTYRFEVIGFTLNAYINGALVASGVDPNNTFNSGSAGLEIDSFGPFMQARFDNVLIQRYALDWYNVKMVDTLPAGLTYVSSSCAATVAGQVVTHNLGTLDAGESGNCTIVAFVNACPASMPNRAELQVGLPVHIEQSNSVTVTSSCSSPTPTRTRTRTVTQTLTLTRTPSSTLTGTSSLTRTMTATLSVSPSPTATPSSTPSPTRSFTPSFTPTRTLSPSLTQTVTYTVSLTSTPSETPSQTPTRTPSRTITLSSTPSVSFTPSASATATPTQSPSRTTTSSSTSTLTRTPSASITATPSRTPTATVSSTLTETASSSPSHTVSPAASPTSSPTVTDSFTATASFTSSSTQTWSRTATPSSTLSSTRSQTPSASPTHTISPIASPTSSPTVTASFTPSSTPSRSPTATPSFTLSSTPSVTRSQSPTPTASPTRTPSSSATATPSSTPSQTRSSTPADTASFSPTPAPMPFQLFVDAYNGAGEKVRSIYRGPAGLDAGQALLSSSAFQPGQFLYFSNLGPTSLGSAPLSWQGDNDQGQMLSSGVYYLRFESLDPFGVSQTSIRPVNLLDPPAAASMEVFNSAGERVAVISLPASAGEPSMVRPPSQAAVAGQALDLEVKGSNGTATVPWMPLNSMGQPLESGTYSFVLRTGGQGATIQSFSLTLLKDPSQAPLTLKAFQHPLGTGRLEVRHSLGAGARLLLYNAAGELIAQESDTGIGKVVFNAASLSSGIYVVVLREPGSSRRSVIKVALRR